MHQANKWNMWMFSSEIVHSVLGSIPQRKTTSFSLETVVIAHLHPTLRWIISMLNHQKVQKQSQSWTTHIKLMATNLTKFLPPMSTTLLSMVFSTSSRLANSKEKPVVTCHSGMLPTVLNLLSLHMMVTLVLSQASMHQQEWLRTASSSLRWCTQVWLTIQLLAFIPEMSMGTHPSSSLADGIRMLCLEKCRWIN